MKMVQADEPTIGLMDGVAIGGVKATVGTDSRRFRST